MAFEPNKLEQVNGRTGDRQCMWLYNSQTDSLATVNTSGYFNDAAHRLRVADVIMFVQLSNATPAVPIDAATLIVATTAAGVVDVTNGEDISTSDSD